MHAVGADTVIGRNRKRQKKLIKAAKANKSLPVKGGDLPVGGEYPLTCLGVTSEAFGDALGDYVRSNPDSSLKCEPLLCHLVFLPTGFCRVDLLALKLFLPLRCCLASCQASSMFPSLQAVLFAQKCNAFCYVTHCCDMHSYAATMWSCNNTVTML